ncbi:MAG: hypothetical protein ACRDH9_03110 [Actinomycetota bacterium]
MKKIARFVALTVVALIGLVPLPASAAAANVLDVELETANRVTASDDCLMDNDECIHVLTATVTDTGAPPAAEVPISFEIEGDGPSNADGPEPGLLPDATCTTTGGICKVSFHASTEGTDTVRAWIDDGNPLTLGDSSETVDTEGTGAAAPMTDVVEVSWYEGVLNVYVPPLGTPEVEERTAAPSTAVTFEARVLEINPPTGEPAETLLANVDAEILPSTPATGNADQQATKADIECPTLQTGTCTLSYPAGATPGVDLIRAWIDRNDNPNAATPTGDEEPGATSGYEGDDTETLAAEGTGTGKDITDVVQGSISASPILQVSPITQTKTTGETASFTASVTLGGTGQNAQPVAMTVFSGPNNGKTAVCNTGAGGTCNLTYVGGTTAGTDKVRMWVDTNGNGQIDEGDATEDVGVNGATPEPDTTAVAQINWVAPTPPPNGGGDDDKCEQAKKSLKKAKKGLKKAKASGDEDRIKKAKKKVKRAKRKKQSACAGA